MLGQRCAKHLVENWNDVQKYIETVNETKKYVYEKLEASIDVEVNISHGNYLLFWIKHPLEVYSYLRANRINVREKVLSTNGGLRVSIGSRNESEKFVQQLASWEREK